MKEILAGLVERDNRNPGDYERDGLLFCGICHQPKQTWIDLSGVERRLVPVTCRCEEEKEEIKKDTAAAESFNNNMRQRWADGICCPDAFPYSFADDDLKTPNESAVCQKYVERWNEIISNRLGILFYGNVGTGKTFYASCIGNGLLEKQIPVASTNFPRLLNLLQETQAKQKLLDRLAIYRLLIIDDLGVERNSAYAAEQIFNIVDARYRSKLPVVITTNLTLEELKKPATMQYARIYDKVLEMCPIRIKMTGESRREAIAAERKRLAEQILLDHC